MRIQLLVFGGSRLLSWITVLAAGMALSISLPSFAQSRRGIPDTIAQRALACAACHGKEGRATRDGYFPRIAGKPAAYLYNQLINFREGRRQHPAMTYIVSNLADAYLMELANYFAGVRLPYPPSLDIARAADLRLGRALILAGDQTRKIPACTSCHGAKLTGMLSGVPGLVGLSRDYTNAQLGSWKAGTRRATSPDCMGEVSRQLTPADIEAVTSWLAAQPAPQDMRPLPAGAIKLPVPCGSVEQ